MSTNPLIRKLQVEASQQQDISATTEMKLMPTMRLFDAECLGKNEQEQEKLRAQLHNLIDVYCDAKQHQLKSIHQYIKIDRGF